MYYTYILRCMDDSLYTGYTSDINRRIKEHKKGINSKYTKAKKFKNLEVFFILNSRSDAMKLECRIKKLSRIKKIWVINNPDEFVEEMKSDLLFQVGKK